MIWVVSASIRYCYPLTLIFNCKGVGDDKWSLYDGALDDGVLIRTWVSMVVWAMRMHLGFDGGVGFGGGAEYSGGGDLKRGEVRVVRLFSPYFYNIYFFIYFSTGNFYLL